MKKRVLSVLLAVSMMSGMGVVSYANSGDYNCTNFEFKDASGNLVRKLASEPMTANITVKNNTQEAKNPAVVVASYDNDMLDGIWYEQASDLEPGSSEDLSVDFTPVSTGANTTIDALLLDGMKSLAISSKQARLLSDSTDLESIVVNGAELEDYSDDQDTYMYQTKSAISSIEAYAVDGGEKIEISKATDFPSVSTITVTAGSGRVRTIQIVAYENEDDLKELIPIVSYGGGSWWAGSSGTTNAKGQFTLTGKAGAATNQHFRYAMNGFPDYTFGSGRIMQIDLTFTPTEYKETQNSGKSSIYFEPTPRPDYGFELKTKWVEGKQYNLRIIFDQDRVMHMWFEDEYYEQKLDAKNESIKNFVLSQSSPIEANAQNTVVFERPVFTIYPSSYTIITKDGEVQKPDTQSLEAESEQQVMLLSGGAENSAKAAGYTYANIKQGQTADEITVSGKGSGNVAMMLLDSSALGADATDSDGIITQVLEAYESNIDNNIKMTKNEIFYFKPVAANGDGSWSITVPMDGIERKGLVLLSSTGETGYIDYASINYRKNIIPVLKESAGLDDDNEKLVSSITEYISFISDETELYRTIENKKTVAALAKDDILALDEAADDSVANLKTTIDKAITIAAASESLVSDYSKITAFVTGEDALLAAISDSGKAVVVKNMCGKKYTSFKDYDEKLLAELAFEGFYYNTNKSGENLDDYLDKYNKYIGLDLSLYSKLSATNRAKGAKKLVETSASKTSEMQSNLDKIVKDLRSTSTSGGGGGGGSSSSGKGSGTDSSKPNTSGDYSGSISSSISDKNLQEQKYAYSDMKDAAWAADAVDYLSKNQIVSGYSDDTFRPNAKITRAEFTQMVVKAFVGDMNFDYKIAFSDVMENDWFAKAVNTAYCEGIISGDESGMFRPNDNISREDMAVIIYKAGEKFNLFSAADSYLPFDDDAQISEYAKTAVYTLKNASVISGVGNGAFAPKENANRAAAAQMIYSLISNYNG